MAVATYSRAILAPDANVLRAIRDDDISIAIWERDPPIGPGDIELAAVCDLRFNAALGELPDRLSREFDRISLKNGFRRHLLAADIAMLANRFATILELNQVEIRLEHVTTNACKKFHSDFVTARLICTYIGPGTQWLDDSDTADCDCGEPHQIQQMKAGDVALLKGRLWSQTQPAIHRSPPIEGSGADRLVLVINPASTAG